MTKLQEVAKLGQSIWLDNIHRTLIVSGELQSLIDEGLRGVTSNPTIFEKAISGSTAYDGEVERLAGEGKSAKEIYESLAMEDIAMAADLLRPVYDAAHGDDGFVSLEVSPDLAHDTEGTVAEARRLFSALNRPNVMIKVPATEAGLPAVERLTAEGINVNVTLIFSLRQYEEVAEVYIRGLERRAEEGKDLREIASVASVFVSRVDTMVDPLLEKAGALDLLGKIAIANSKVIYTRFRRIFSTKRWRRLAGLGARMQRLLWGSTSTKNPRYPDTLYVDELIGPYTVNTVPPETLQAFRDHGKVARTVGRGLMKARADLKRLSALGIDLEQVCRKLQEDGVAAFKKSFDGLLSRIGEKKEKSRSSFEERMKAAFGEAKKERVVPRLWARDYTLWKPDPEGISNRLGWLESAKRMAERVGELGTFAVEIRNEGYRHCLLLGMGGSSLAPALFRKVFGVE
ncbi:MAG TPA: transaldolase, partial [Syntrophales bacterium]|nr:transaldolase [Syntrophales bacterium]